MNVVKWWNFSQLLCMMCLPLEKKTKQCAFTERKSVVFNTLYFPENSITNKKKTKTKQDNSRAAEAKPEPP